MTSGSSGRRKTGDAKGTAEILPQLHESLKLRYNSGLELERTQDRGFRLVSRNGLPSGTLVTFPPGSYLSGRLYSNTPTAKAVDELLARRGLKHEPKTLHSILLSVHLSQLKASTNSSWKPYLDLLQHSFVKFPSGATDAVMYVVTLKDGLCLHTETGDRPTAH